MQASDGANPLKPTMTSQFVLGDANLDGNVDSSDLGDLLLNFGDDTGLGWGAGNFNSDSIVDSSDLGALLLTFGFDSPLAVAAVSASTTLPFDFDPTASLDRVYADADSDADEEDSYLLWQ